MPAFRTVHRLALGGDATPADTLPSVVAALARTLGAEWRGAIAEFQLRAIAKDYARAVWARTDLPYEDWAESRLLAAIEDGKAALLVTGTTDTDDRTDVALWAAARAAGTPSLAFLDHYATSALRFLNDDGALVLPDCVHAPYAEQREALLAIGFAPDQIVLGEDLHLADLLSDAAAPADEVAAVRASWGVEAGGSAVLFVSECAREVNAANDRLPYDEVDMAHRLVAHLEGGWPIASALALPGPVHLVIRPHPKDVPGKYANLVGRLEGRLAIDGDTTLRTALHAADLVIGMESAVLHEAMHCGRPTVSTVPGGWFAKRWGAHLVQELIHV